MRIITVSREFGSGGRELGKRIADNMGIAYFDREIISAVAEGSQFDESYVEAVLDRGMFRDIPVTFGRSIANMSNVSHTTQKIVAEQHRIITEMASHGDCVIVGRNADVLLRDMQPLKLFVYADMQSKINRCRSRAPEGEDLTDKEMAKMIKRIDKARARTHAFFSEVRWGAKEGYHLCVNTTDTDIKALAGILADYAEHWFSK
ncbi:MAG: cytidylate kinase-like family protein [Clostridia bacterium]|nr:cytidylate kinase-like family protein [Clostridia bacterium]